MARFNVEQKTILKGISAGISILALSFGGAWVIFRSRFETNAPSELHALTMECLLVSVLPLFLLIATVANNRFLSDLIDPIRPHAPDTRMVILQRCLQNTLEQTVLLFAVLLGFSTVITPDSAWFAVALTVNFLLGRALFVLGYLKHPLYRATGMAVSAYPSFITLLYLSAKFVIGF